MVLLKVSVYFQVIFSSRLFVKSDETFTYFHSDDNSVEIENPISITNESQDWDWDWDRELSQRWRHQEEFSEDGSCSNEYHQEKGTA